MGGASRRQIQKEDFLVNFFDFLQGKHARNELKFGGLLAPIEIYLALENQLSSCWRWPEMGGASRRQIQKEFLVDFFIFYRENMLGMNWNSEAT